MQLVQRLTVCTFTRIDLTFCFIIMCVGDREQEENLMQEWFGILNKKNELIKRQMELNFM